MMAKKAPNPIDKHVGSRVRMRRMMLSMSQEKLGDALALAVLPGLFELLLGRLKALAELAGVQLTGGVSLLYENHRVVAADLEVPLRLCEANDVGL